MTNGVVYQSVNGAMNGMGHGGANNLTNGVTNPMNTTMNAAAQGTSGLAHQLPQAPSDAMVPVGFSVLPLHTPTLLTLPQYSQPPSQIGNSLEMYTQYPQPTMNHGAQVQYREPAQSNTPQGLGQGGLISPPHGLASVAQIGGHQYTHSGPVAPITRIPQSQSYTAGFPQSQSYNSGLSLMSPGATPQHLEGGRMAGSFSGSDTGYNGRLTEPRNYAPRTSGQPVETLPPPRFNLGVAQAATQNSNQDPFGSPSDSNALIPFPVLPSHAVQQAMLIAAPQNILNKSSKLIELTCTMSGYPTLEMALSVDFFPFIDGAGSVKPAMFGVIRLKNIPFSTKRSEIVAFIGRNSKMLNDGDEPVHIIMDRATSKTMDAFVEFATMEDAMRCAERHHQFAQAGRVSRLGDRNIEVELSSQAALMKELFPLARGVFWDGATPQIYPYNPREPWVNFKGFISCEEMVMLVKHVEVPHRSPFSKECPQRPYECLISTLRKFPWFSTNNITISHRGAMYKATVKLLRLLSKSVAQSDDPVNLNAQLFKRVVKTVMECKGFTTIMKDNIAYMVQMPEAEQRRHGQPLKPHAWVHQYTISPKPDIPLDVIDWYIRIIREQTTRDVLVRPISERTAIQETLKDTDDYWGYFYHEVAYAQGPQFDTMTLGQCAYAEFSAIERVLARALGRD
ncbi:hypothetical protein FZEAL_4841 [Fusarium zealandicum]|uniref:RRM domain-containing protein n=1 Tax=Fusarium zealandicum TaxID=1053134 RepID=A0A8H4XKE8_9HYPO|nr:hypothetical protein FZEAL_4841 [Fusarium zealandicum]